MSYRAKFDASHKPITQALKRMGWPFVDCARYSGLGCDLLTRHRDGYPIFLELKTPGPPSSRKFTESEMRLKEMFPQFFRVAMNLDHALEALGLTDFNGMCECRKTQQGFCEFCRKRKADRDKAAAGLL